MKLQTSLGDVRPRGLSSDPWSQAKSGVSSLQSTTPTSHWAMLPSCTRCEAEIQLLHHREGSKDKVKVV